MELTFKKIALIGKRHPSVVSLSQETFKQILQFLASFELEIFIEDATSKYLQEAAYPVLNLHQIGQQCDLVVVVGGDGTMLGIGCALARSKIPIVGINQGRLGFITDIPFDSYTQVLTDILQGQYETDQRHFLDVTIFRYGNIIHQTIALNDLVLSRASIEGMIEVAIYVDEQFVATQRADGLIVSTATGSTAYNLSAGGPLLHPSVTAFVVTPIAAHNLSNRPIVISQQSVIKLELLNCKNATSSFDSRSFPSLQTADMLEIKTAENSATFLHPIGWSYFDTLRKKLGWNALNHQS